jgi:SAM-dependent methyltransferase
VIQAQSIASDAAWRIWAAQYDDTPNALLALEMRVLSSRLGDVRGRRILDAGSGTGRWMAWAKANGAHVFGIDACHEMILEAGHKPGLAGRIACGDAQRIPVRDNAADIALCSFTLGYLASARPVLRELARVARLVILSDLHPAAVQEGWTRSFRAAGQHYDIEHYDHSAAGLDQAARDEGLLRIWREEPSFGEPERSIFQHAGKEEAFESARRIPAVLITAWTRSSD